MLVISFILTMLAVGPWVTDMGRDGFSVLWTTDCETMGWVQMADGKRVFEEFAGRRVFGRFHNVRIEGNFNGEVVEYCIGNSEVLDKSDAINTRLGAELLQGPYRLKTFSDSSSVCRFSILNDIHMDLDLYRTLASQIDTAATDFIFLNGDMVNKGNYCLDTLARYELDPLGRLSAILPVMYARGNHEGRGDGARNVAMIFPRTGSGRLPFTYMFRQGPVAFVVLDAGETGVKRSRALAGTDIYKEYLLDQMAWAEEAFKSREWTEASYRVCMIHAPMLDITIPGKREVYGWMNHNFVPLLNKAGVNLMIGADLHEYRFTPAGVIGTIFPILVNGTDTRLDVVIEDGKAVCHFVTSDGKVRDLTIDSVL